jgi:hypothetical protein
MKDRLGRLVFDKNRLKPHRRYESFEPNCNQELSVCGIDGLSHAETVTLGDCVASMSGRSQMRGCESLCKSDFCDLGLRMEKTDPVCDAPHFNVVGWPHHSDDLYELQLSFVQRSRLVRR